MALAVALKWYQFARKFPRRNTDIPVTIVHYLADQLEIFPEVLIGYAWTGHTAKRHRGVVLDFLGLRRATTVDQSALMIWLRNEQIPSNQNVDHLIDIARDWLRLRGLVLLTDKQHD